MKRSFERQREACPLQLSRGNARLTTATANEGLNLKAKRIRGKINPIAFSMFPRSFIPSIATKKTKKTTKNHCSFLFLNFSMPVPTQLRYLEASTLMFIVFLFSHPLSYTGGGIASLPGCVLRCTIISLLSVNHLPHRSQRYGFSSVCVSSCTVSVDKAPKLSMQTLHLYGVSPVCFLLCAVKFRLFANSLPQ